MSGRAGDPDGNHDVSAPINTLFLAPQVPWPLDVGSKIRTYNLLMSYAELGPVTLVCYAQDERDAAAADAIRASLAGFHMFTLGPVPGPAGAIAQALHRWPRIVRFFSRQEFTLAVS